MFFLTMSKRVGDYLKKKAFLKSVMNHECFLQRTWFPELQFGTSEYVLLNR